MLWEHEVAGSNPVAPTGDFNGRGVSSLETPTSNRGRAYRSSRPTDCVTFSLFFSTAV
jgi:hypothetical protein